MSKDVLEYTEEELKSLSYEELKVLHTTAESMESRYDTAQKTEKTLMNALYGALANKYFPLFNEDMASAITGNCRYFIRKMANYIEEVLQELLPSDIPYVVYGDTDSIYFSIDGFMQKYQEKNPGLDINEYVDWAHNFELKVVQPVITQMITDFCDELNAYNRDMMGVDREVIADAVVFTAKKKYYARVRDLEGTRYPADDPYIKVMGLEIIKSTTPIWSKKYLKEAIPHILDKDENDLRDWVNEIKGEFVQVDKNEIANVGGVSRVDYNLGDKGIPIGSRAALVHNTYIKDNNLDLKYAAINAGDKCRRLYLTEPNVFNSNIIAFTNDQFTDEIDCIDYDVQFEKMFMKPLNLMVGSLGYDLNKQTETLDDW